MDVVVADPASGYCKVLQCMMICLLLLFIQDQDERATTATT